MGLGNTSSSFETEKLWTSGLPCRALVGQCVLWKEDAPPPPGKAWRVRGGHVITAAENAAHDYIVRDAQRCCYNQEPGYTNAPYGAGKGLRAHKVASAPIIAAAHAALDALNGTSDLWIVKVRRTECVPSSPPLSSLFWLIRAQAAPWAHCPKPQTPNPKPQALHLNHTPLTPNPNPQPTVW